MKITDDMFGTWFGEELKKRNLSVKKFADRSGITKITVLRWKNGQQGVTLYNFCRIAKFFGYEVHLIKRGTEESKLINEIYARGLNELLATKQQGKVV